MVASILKRPCLGAQGQSFYQIGPPFLENNHAVDFLPHLVILSSRRCHFEHLYLFIPDLFPGDLVLSLVGRLGLDQYYLLFFLCSTSHPHFWWSVTLTWHFSGASPTLSSAQGNSACWCQFNISIPTLQSLSQPRDQCSSLSQCHTPWPSLLSCISWLQQRVTPCHLLFSRDAGAQECRHRVVPQSSAGCPCVWAGYLSDISCKGKISTAKSILGRVHASPPEQTSDLQHSNWTDMGFIFKDSSQQVSA